MVNTSIREARQKSTSGYVNTPLGAYGRYIQLHNGVDLESGLLLGEPGSTTIKEDGITGVTTIESTYVSAGSELPYYLTTIINPEDNNLQTVITSTLKYGGTTIYTKTTTITDGDPVSIVTTLVEN